MIINYYMMKVKHREIKYSWLLFDADGTLFDYDQAEKKSLEAAFLQSGADFKEDYIDIYRKINKSLWLEFEKGKISQEKLKTERFRLLFEEIGIESDSAAFSKRYLENLAQCGDLIQGAEELLQRLYGEVGLMLITNGLTKVQRSRLAHSEIGKYFPDVVISEELGVSKPDGKIFDVTFRKMGNPKKEDVLIIGDSLSSDMKGGAEYGIDTCWYNPDAKVNDSDVRICYEIRSLDEIPEILTFPFFS